MEQVELHGFGDGSGSGSGFGYGSGYGSGSGYGFGYGSGDGSGFGYGFGDGDGYGYGSGSGFGSGFGSGSGSGYGSGYGSGDGDGSGFGYGFGDGYGDGSDYWKLHAEQDPDIGPRISLELERGGGLAYWRSHADGRAANGGSGGTREAGTIEEIAGPLELCGSGALHATTDPSGYSGEAIWLVLMYAPVEWSGDKVGSLKRELLFRVK